MSSRHDFLLCLALHAHIPMVVRIGRLVSGVSGKGSGYIGRISGICIMMRSFPIQTLDTDLACYVVRNQPWC
jgi:hypothetical protein